jgi:hypothetical protein
MFLYRQIALALTLVLAAALSAAAEEVNQEDLRTAVTAYWKAMAEEDWQTTYVLERKSEPDTSLSATEYYQSRQSIPRHVNPKVESVDEGDDEGTAVVSTAFVLPLGPSAVEVPRTYRSRWERSSGKWYHVGSEPIQP